MNPKSTPLTRKLRNYPEYIHTKEELHKFLHSKIREATEVCGSQEALSKALGHSPQYISQIIGRGKFSAMERAYKETVTKGIVK